MGYEDLCYRSINRDANSLLSNIGEVMKEKEENKNYHTVLSYTELHKKAEVDDEVYRAMSQADREEYHKNFRTCFSTYLLGREISGIITEYYHDIVNDNGRPDYRTIEVLCLMNQGGRCDDEGFVVYNGYKIKPLPDLIPLFLSFLLELGSNINSHLLSYIVILTPHEEFSSFKESCIKLQEFFNETEENIRHALVSLQNLNLITFSEENNGDLVINLNKDNILKLDNKYCNYSVLEDDIKINNYYKERIIIDIPSCPHCFKELNMDDIKYILKNYDEDGLRV